MPQPSAVPLFLLVLSTFAFIAADKSEEQCDWTGSGVVGSRGVTPVYLRCRAGSVGWREGALRVLLRLPGGREFRACIRPAGAPISLYLEAPRALTKLYTPEDIRRRLVRCFQSRGGQAALYVEAEGKAEFSYDLEPLPRGTTHYDPSQECRPCTMEEMTQAYCTSELVARGIVQRVEPIEDSELSMMTLKVTKLVRTVESEGSEDVGEDWVRVGVGRACGARHGHGEVVLMARRKLGRLVLSCAPRLHQWQAAAREATRNATAHCRLNS